MLGHFDIHPTQQRVDIAQILFDCPLHLSVDPVLAPVNEARPSVSKATVYNTLGLFGSLMVPLHLHLSFHEAPGTAGGLL